MKTVYTFLLITSLLTTAWAEGVVTLTAREGAPGPITPSLNREARAALDRGLQWLLSKQQEDGHWSNRDFPALTALPLWALVKGEPADKEAVQKAVKYILSCVHDNGAIYVEPKEDRKGGGLSTYNTAICMIALHEAGER